MKYELEIDDYPCRICGNKHITCVKCGYSIDPESWWECYISKNVSP